MGQVIVGVDPHKLSATIEVVDDHEQMLGSGRFSTDKSGYAAMRTYAKAWPDRVWAVEGANGVGRPLAQRLLQSGEQVLDVPAKLAARVRLFDTGHNRKTDARDAHSIAIVAVRTKTLRVMKVDGELEALRMLTRPAGSPDPASGPDRRPTPGPARRTPPRAGETRHHHRPGQGHARVCPPA
ncbi:MULTISPECIES: IS110 family transposase [unclassified Nocardioides]|uniref:IS110 family transposase n=1 Tax=unclassified Nocardioides TaxID=2615069 RepID=UPI00360D9C10